MTAATTVICLHGLRRAPADWEGVAARLPASWEVRIPELPAAPDEALAVVDAAMTPGAAVFAHSMGAVIALRALARHPRSLAALVLTGSFFPPARNGRTTAASVLDYLGHRIALGRQIARRPSGGPRSARSSRALGSLLRDAARPRVSVPSGAAGSVPVLVVHARDDHYVPVDFAIAAAARHPAWTLCLLDRGGHHVHAERPRSWLEHVQPWLDERD